MLFFFGFEGLTWKGHRFLYPWFSFLPMYSCDEVLSRVPLALIGCFFLSYLGRTILLSVFFFRLGIVFYFSIGGRYAVRIKSWLFSCNKIIGIVSLLVFLLLFLLWRANNLVFFLYLRILLDPLWMPLRIEWVLGVCSTPSFNSVSLYVLFGIISKQIFL